MKKKSLVYIRAAALKCAATLHLKGNSYSRPNGILKVLPVSSGICGIPALFELLDLDDFLLAPRFVALGSLAALPPAAPPAFGGTALLLAFFLDFDL